MVQETARFIPGTLTPEIKEREGFTQVLFGRNRVKGDWIGEVWQMYYFAGLGMAVKARTGSVRSPELISLV
jgi:hypothetical protein